MNQLPRIVVHQSVINEITALLRRPMAPLGRGVIDKELNRSRDSDRQVRLSSALRYMRAEALLLVTTSAGEMKFWLADREAVLGNQFVWDAPKVEDVEFNLVGLAIDPPINTEPVVPVDTSTVEDGQMTAHDLLFDMVKPGQRVLVAEYKRRAFASGHSKAVVGMTLARVTARRELFYCALNPASCAPEQYSLVRPDDVAALGNYTVIPVDPPKSRHRKEDIMPQQLKQPATANPAPKSTHLTLHNGVKMSLEYGPHPVLHIGSNVGGMSLHGEALRTVCAFIEHTQPHTLPLGPDSNEAPHPNSA